MPLSFVAVGTVPDRAQSAFASRVQSRIPLGQPATRSFHVTDGVIVCGSSLPASLGMTDIVRPFPAAGLRADAKHIIDVLIEERAPRLSSGAAWPILRPPLYSLLNYPKARRMADAIEPMGGRAALDYLQGILRLTVQTERLDRVRREGPFLILANHPTGITDGIALYDAVKPVRPDLMFYANSDAHRVCPGFIENLIPVEWVPAKRTRERTRVTLKMTAEAVDAGRPIMIFPAGRLARLRDGVVIDPEWQPSAVSIARKHALTIVPAHMTGPYSTLFHFFDKFSKELRDITLFHELLNKEGKTYRIAFGPPITPDQIAGDSAVMSRKIKHYIERVLAQDVDAAFDPAGPECAYRDPPSTSAGALPHQQQDAA
jgi:putative hemolysin